MLENTAPFGRHMRGVSYVFATKDRPGHLRANGRPGKTPGKTFMGTFVVDDSETVGPDFAMRFFAPKDDDDSPPRSTRLAELADTVHDVIAALPEHTVSSTRMLFAEMRRSGPPGPRRHASGTRSMICSSPAASSRCPVRVAPRDIGLF